MTKYAEETVSLVSVKRSGTYFIRDGANAPRITVSVMLLSNDRVVRGWAFCHPVDNPERKKGREYAIERAMQAFQLQDNYCRIKSDWPKYLSILCGIKAPLFFGEFNPKLTEFEKYLLKQE